MKKLSIILPAKDEEQSIGKVILDLTTLFPEAEVLVVNDGSSDSTESIARNEGAKVVSHPYSQGNGAAIKTGARHATGEILIFMDADGQHKAKDITRLLNSLEQGYDMVVGARSRDSQASLLRGLGNRFYNWFASLIVGHKVEDLTSGMRAVNASKFREFLYMLPNGFSYPTTITMAFFRSGYPVAYEPIEAGVREGKSHLRIWRDGVRFLLIIFKVATLYSPLKVFFPIAFSLFLIGCSYYLFTFITSGRFTNMSALMLTTSISIFLMGLISEQITSLMFRTQKETDKTKETD